MGQYHSVINLDKKAGYSPRSLGSSLKLSEQAGSLTPCAALLILLSDPNGWGGERIAVVGDYADDSDLQDADPFPASELWKRVDDSWEMKNVGWLARKVLVESGVVEVFLKESFLGSGMTFYTGVLEDPSDPPLAPQVAVVNLDRREVLSPPLLGDAGTLLATAADCHYGGTGTALYVLLAASNKGGPRGGGDINSRSPLIGSWAGDRVAVLPVSEVPEGYTDITAPLRSVLASTHEGEYRIAGDGTVRRVPFSECFGA